MATKVNVRFVLVLGMTLATAVIIVGGLYYLHLRKDAARNIRRGDEAAAAGDYQKAFDNYGRAVHKEPGNMEAIRKLEESILKLVPETADEARNLYRERLGVLQHLARHNPTNAKYHLSLLQELARGARQGGGSNMWAMVQAAAEEMERQLPETDPDRPFGKLYSSMATFQLYQQRSRDELKAAESDAKAAVAGLPNNDLAWANLIYGQNALIEKMTIDGQSQAEIGDKVRDAAESTAKAAQAVPNGPEVARLVLWTKMIELSRASSTPDTPGEADSPDAPAVVTEEQIAQQADHLLNLMLAESDADPALVSESADVLLSSPDNKGYERTIKLLDDYIAKHPQAIDKQFRRGSYRFRSRELDQAEADATSVLDAPTLPTSFLGQVQFDLRMRAAGLLVDIAHLRWETADAADKDAKLAAVEAARNRLVAMGADPATDPLVLRADGKIAYSKGQYAKATTYFEKLVNDPAGRSDEVLRYSAECLERVGEVGVAYARLVDAMKLQPYSTLLTYHKARLEVRLNRLDDAEATLKGIPEKDKQRPEIQQVAQAIAAQRMTRGGASPGGGSTEAQIDPAMDAIRVADDALAKGNPDAARAALQSALAQNPENFPLLLASAELELRTGQGEKSREYLDRAKAIQSDNDLVRRIDIALRYDDPVEAALQYHEAVIADESLRAVALSISLDAVAVRYRATVAELEKRTITDEQHKAQVTANIAKYKDIAERAAQESAKWIAKAQSVASDNPQFIEFQFNKSLQAKDWAAAEQLIARAKALNLDQVDGDLFRGRLELARENYRESVRILASVTERMSFLSGGWRLLGAAYQGMGNYGQAVRAYEKAYAANPLDMDTARLYVGLLINGGDRGRALTVTRSIQLQAPRDPVIRELWLDQEAASGNKVLAFAERRRIYRETPDDRENAKALAKLLGQTEPVRELMLSPRGGAVYTDQRWLHMTAEEKAEAINENRNAWRAESDAIIAKLAKDSEDDLELAVTRAQLLQARADVAGGERILRDFIARHSSAPTSQMYIELANYLNNNNQFVKSRDAANEAIKYQDPQVREGNRALARFFMQLSLYEDALVELQKVREAGPDRTIDLQIVECNMRLRRFDEADAKLKALLAESSEDVTTLMLAAGLAEGQALALLDKGQIAAAERKFAEERDTLARAEALDPTTPTPRVLLAQSFLNEYSRTQKPSLLDDALLQLERADEIRADSDDTSKIRIEVFKAKGATEAQAAELIRLLQRNPDNPVARQQLTQLYVDTRQFELARQSLEEAVAINPTLPFWHEALGDMYARLFNDAAASNKAYRQAFALDPTAGRFNRVMESALGINPPDNAGVIREIELHADYMKEWPRLRLAYARALYGVDRRDDAINQVKLAYADMREQINAGKLHRDELSTWFAAMRFLYKSDQIRDVEALLMEVTGNKPDIQELRMMARTWLATGEAGHSRAQELERQAVDACPADDPALKLELLRELADVFLVSRDFASAADTYNKILVIKPDFVSVLNNLAFMMAENMGQATQAVELAERAVALAPRDASILDTTGWVYFRAGNLEKAEQRLRESLAVNDNSFETHYHIAEVQAQKGDFSSARGHLQKALELKPDPDTRQKIERLVDDIRNKP